MADQSFVVVSGPWVRYLPISAPADEPCSSADSAALASSGRILSEHLPELHPPLVGRVDVPDNSLGKHDVLVQSDQRAGDLARE
jgi:hypothetical protein